MSVLFKSLSNNNVSIGGSNKGFPPGDISNIIHKVNDSKVLIKWTDPEDTVLDNVIFIKWKGTLLVRNSDHYPTSIKDGDVVLDNTIRNKYKDIFFEDTGLVNNHIYYYRFFPYSEDRVYNDNSNMIFKDKPLNMAPILKDNTWEQIIVASESGNIPSTWNIGDEIDITLSGRFNEPITLQIWDFNHFDKSDGTGKAGICFGMKHLMKDKQLMNSSDINTGGWNNTNMKKTIMNNIYNSIPIEIRNHIKEVNTYANSGGESSSSSQGLLSKDKVFLLGLTECTDNWSSQNRTETGQKKFPIFSDYDSRIKKLNNGNGSAHDWYSRSPAYFTNDGFCSFNGYGNFGSSTYASSSYGVCVCFNV